jgi:hypothetical protein
MPPYLLQLVSVSLQLANLRLCQAGDATRLTTCWEAAGAPAARAAAGRRLTGLGSAGRVPAGAIRALAAGWRSGCVAGLPGGGGARPAGGVLGVRWRLPGCAGRLHCWVLQRFPCWGAATLLLLLLMLAHGHGGGRHLHGRAALLAAAGRLCPPAPPGHGVRGIREHRRLAAEAAAGGRAAGGGALRAELAGGGGVLAARAAGAARAALRARWRGGGGAC